MSIHDDDVSRREQAGWLAKFKNVLFEAPPTPAETPGPVTSEAREARPPARVANPAVRETLEQTIAEHLGPAFAEFRLQDEALADAIPDESSRLRAVVQVLSKKQMPVAHLLEGIDRGLGALAGSHRAWADKIATRRATQERERHDIEVEFEKTTSGAQREIERLEQAIEAQKRAIADAAAAKQTRLESLDEASAELGGTDHDFRTTYETIEQEYASLREKLARFQSEKARHV
jgi:chromosome segregation ATPase